jgi:hypothetical protein
VVPVHEHTGEVGLCRFLGEPLHDGGHGIGVNDLHKAGGRVREVADGRYLEPAVVGQGEGLGDHGYLRRVGSARNRASGEVGLMAGRVAGPV